MTGRLLKLLLCSCILLFSANSFAVPAFYVQQKGSKPTIRSAHVVLLKNKGVTAVTTQLDYVGNLTPFAMVTVVPKDVRAKDIKVVNPRVVRKVDHMSGPRYAEFWEADPCSKEKIEQRWEMRQRVFNTKIDNPMNKKKKDEAASIPRPEELNVDINPEFQDGPFKFSVLIGSNAKNVSSWLTKAGYKGTSAHDEAVAKYVAEGMNVLVAEVDSNKLELLKGDRAMLAPIRWFTRQPHDSLPVSLGQQSLDGKQELFVHVFAPEKRYLVRNYKNYYPPSNLKVGLEGDNLMGDGLMAEMYNAFADRIWKRNPKAFLTEYVWPAEECSWPCPENDPITIAELMSLGVDDIESTLPKSVSKPKAPDLSDDEQATWDKVFAGYKPKERFLAEKDAKADRQRAYELKKMFERHDYIQTRLHYRYGAVAEDPVFAAAPDHIKGGIDIPKGKHGEAETGKSKGDKTSRFVVRFTKFHEWHGDIKCDNPKRYRWGKMWRSEQSKIDKVWVAMDMAYKKRNKVDISAAVKTEVAELDIKGEEKTPEKKEEKKEEKAGTCGCSLPGGGGSGGPALLLGGLLGAALVLRRRGA